MATQGAEDPATIPSTSDTTQTAAPVEMDTLQSSSEQLPHPVDRIDPQQSMAQPSDDPETTTTAAAATAADPAHPQPSSQQPQPTLTRKETEALGPATETAITQPTSAGPVLSITLMLTTGARHPYKIDEKYLKNRNCEAHAKDGTFEPRELSGYKLKELIWTDWRSEWEPRPAAPSSIRLIIWGKMVDDKKCLSDYNFSLETPNVVHMTIKPADFGEDDDAAGGKHAGKGSSIRARDGGDGGAGCRCVIQ